MSGLAANRRIAGEAVVVLAGLVLGALGTLVGVRVLTGMLEPATYGVVALGMVYVNLAIYLLATPLRSAATRFHAIAASAGRFREFSRQLRSIGIRILAPLVLLSIVLLIAGRSLAGWTVLLSVMLTIDAVFLGLQTGARRRGVVAFLQTLLAWTRFGFAALLIIMTDRFDAEIVFIGFCLSALLNIVLQGACWLRSSGAYDIEPRADDAVYSRRDFVGYLWPLVLTGPISWMMLFVDRLAIELFASTDDVGIYFALYQIGFAPIIMLYTGGWLLVAPIAFEQAGDGRAPGRLLTVFRRLEVVALCSLAATVALAAVVGLLHSSIGDLLLGPAYQEHTGLLPWLVLSGGLLATGNQLMISIQSGLDLRPLMVQRTMAMLIAVACYGLGAFWGGLEGAVMGGVVFAGAYLSTAVLVHLVVRRRLAASAT